MPDEEQPEADQPQVIWENTMDGGTWKTQVLRTGSYTGVLQICDKESTLVHQEEVGLAYQALFGPDVDDVAKWEQICIDVVDHPEKRTPT